MNINIRNKRIQSHYESGKSVSELAAKYNLSERAIYNIIDCDKSEDRDKQQKMIMEFTKKGKSAAQIAKLMAVSVSTVNRARRNDKARLQRIEDRKKTKLVLYSCTAGCSLIATYDSQTTLKALERYNDVGYVIMQEITVEDAEKQRELLVNLMAAMGLPHGAVETVYKQENHYPSIYLNSISNIMRGLNEIPTAQEQSKRSYVDPLDALMGNL